jgi:peroxiredoxin
VQQLIGCRLPDFDLPSTDGFSVNLSNRDGTFVIFCFPYTGRPDFPNPPDWDNIPGAHGSTPQAQAFSLHYEEFKKLGISVFGLSFQDTSWQSEFVKRTSLRVALLSDKKKLFSSALGLPEFKAGTQDYLRRLTFISKNGIITHVRYPIDIPENDAAETLKLFKAVPHHDPYRSRQ